MEWAESHITASSHVNNGTARVLCLLEVDDGRIYWKKAVPIFPKLHPLNSTYYYFYCLPLPDGGVILSAVEAEPENGRETWRRRAMGRVFVVESEGRSYRCKFCNTQLALADDLASKAFHCRHGKAYLFNNAMNFSSGALEQRMMLSGLHTVADIFCCTCGQIVGWKYEAAHEKSQKYKEGKFVLERGRIVHDIEFSTGFYVDSQSSISDTEDN